MANLGELRAQFADVDDPQMRAGGYALWIVWQGNENPVVVQTLEDYGGVRVAEADGSWLWFFFSTDVFLASARLSVWARFNQLAITIQIFPCGIKVARNGVKSLEFDEPLLQQEVNTAQDFQVWVHAALKETAESLPGISLIDQAQKPVPQGMIQGLWFFMDADGRLPYASSLGWYALLRPVGNPVDKSFQVGWREFFGQVEAVLQRNKFRFTVHDFFLMFPLEGLSQFKSWCRDFLAMVERLKEEAPDKYWPCVLAVVDRKGLNFNEELPRKSQVEWEQLTPDYPFMSMRNALMLGGEFVFHEARFAPSRESPDDWVSIALRGEDGAGAGTLPQLIPGQLFVGSHPHCFYCGQRSHESWDCPSRLFDEQDPSLWNHVGRLDFNDMREAVRKIDADLAEVPPEKKNTAIASLSREFTPEGYMLSAFSDINWVVQMRAARFFWRARNKDIQKAATDLLPEDGNQIWSLLDDMPRLEPGGLEKELHNLSLRAPEDFRIMSLRGFAAMERGDLEKALGFWRDAEMFSSFPIVQHWHQFLQARAMECLGRYTPAINLYNQVLRAVPGWTDAQYRKMVCEVKNGFSDLAGKTLMELVGKNGHYFNKALLDPEIERGHIQITACLYQLWTSMEAQAKEEEVALYRMRDELPSWFMPGHPFAEQVADRIHKLMQITSVNNYVAFQMLATGRTRLERDLQVFIAQDGRNYKNKFKSFTERLKVIHDESAWFPFPKVLVDFNKSYNMSVANLNWALKANFHLPEAFRKAQMLLEQEEERLKRLEGRMRFLRIVRDSTLFLLAMGQTFFWLELAGILCIFVVLPLVLLYGDKVGMEWTAGVIAKEQWLVQKVLFFIVSVLALVIAVLRTILRFEYIRDKILTKAKETALKNVRKT